MTIVERNRRVLLDALRSGEYNYGRGVLREEHEMETTDEVVDLWCFFGVCCDVFHKTCPEVSRWSDNKFRFECNTEVHGSEVSKYYPPYAVLDFFGISPERQTFFMNMNDRDCDTFEDMAIIFEREYNL